MTSKTMLGLGCFCLNLAAFGAATWYVAPWGDDSNDGLSWGTAMRSPEKCVKKWTTSKQTMVISNGTYYLSEPIVVNVESSVIRSISESPADVVLDGQNACQCIYSTKYRTTVRGVTVCNGKAVSGGGIYLSNTENVITNCIARSCHAVGKNQSCAGGAIYCKKGTVVDVLVHDSSCVMEEWTSGDKYARGGGIYAEDATVAHTVVRGCTVTNVHPNAYHGLASGGGIYLADKSSMLKCQVLNCSAVAPNTNTAGDGGGVYATGSTMIEDSDISGNFASYGGGAVRVHGAALSDASLRRPVISRCTFSNNTQNTKSTLLLSMAEVSLKNSQFVANSGKGAPIGICAKSISVSDCFVTNNTCTCGAIDFDTASSYTAEDAVVSNCVFVGNTGTEQSNGGGIVNGGTLYGTNLIVSCRFLENTTSARPFMWNAGAASTRSCEVWFRNCLLARNVIAGKHGGINGTMRNDRGRRTRLENCTIVSNSVTSTGGGFIKCYSESGSYYCESNTIIRACVFANVGGLDIATADSGHALSDAATVSYTCVSTQAGLNRIGSTGGNFLIDKEKELFADVAHCNYRPTFGSQLREKVVPAPWMGTGSRNGMLDLGAGYRIEKLGSNGVLVTTISPSPRLSGHLADIGCCEYQLIPGLMFIFK